MFDPSVPVDINMVAHPSGAPENGQLQGKPSIQKLNFRSAKTLNRLTRLNRN
jgi:hypothetical protein